MISFCAKFPKTWFTGRNLGVIQVTNGMDQEISSGSFQKGYELVIYSGPWDDSNGKASERFPQGYAFFS
jgi:hypothetical protein